MDMVLLKWMHMNTYECTWMHMNAYECIWMHMNAYACADNVNKLNIKHVEYSFDFGYRSS